jgi:hypothetical protein
MPLPFRKTNNKDVSPRLQVSASIIIAKVWGIFVLISLVSTVTTYQGTCGGITVMGGRFHCTVLQYYFGLDNIYFLLGNIVFTAALAICGLIVILKRVYRMLQKP